MRFEMFHDYATGVEFGDCCMDDMAEADYLLCKAVRRKWFKHPTGEMKWK